MATQPHVLNPGGAGPRASRHVAPAGQGPEVSIHRWLTPLAGGHPTGNGPSPLGNLAASASTSR
jgi:hypothetical protein